MDNLDTYLDDVKVNDVINLSVPHKTKGWFGKINIERNYHQFVITHVTDELITCLIRRGYSPRMGICTREELKEQFERSEHILVTRPKAVNGRMKAEEIINEDIE